MTDASDAAGHSSAGGQGRLARLIATRGGAASPEAPFVIEHREALIYMLCEAAELEHGIMCQYLFAAFSLKQSTSEGLTEDEVATVTRWRQRVSHVATQEMLHLALVHNLLSAIGAAPHLARPNLPQPANHYPAGVQLSLLPFGEQALRHFMFLERPEGMDLADAEGLVAVGRAQPLLSERDIVPRGQDFATVGHLYRSIEAGLARLAERHSEDWLFVGPPRAQATAEHFGWAELIAVTDLASARRAIEEILEQGEGPRGDWRNAHFGQFVEILDEYQQLCAANPAFKPVRPVMAANVRPHEGDIEVPLISDLLTARVTDLFNVSYEILLQILERFFAHTQETDTQLKTLADATIGLMTRVLKPLGDLITTLPVGEGHAGMAAGPSFELFYENDYLMPHREAAWALLAERLDEAGWLCSELQAGKGQRIAGRLDPVLAALREMSRSLAVQLPAGSAHAQLATAPDGLGSGQLDQLLGRARELADRAAAAEGEPGELSGLFATAYEIVTSAASGTDCAPADQALIVPRMVGSVLRPLADALSSGAAQRTGAAGTARAAAAPGQPGAAAARVWDAARSATAVRTRMSQAGGSPAGLSEAAAALQDLACRLAPPAEAAARRAELWQLQAGLRPEVQISRNGPYLVTNVPRLVDYLGTENRPAPQLALCRCGNSALKPLCDGSHARSGFTDAKDPKRIADRRDTYPGQQVTIFDNRGICQHSGLCTDRLAGVFRTGQEPFVAPSGGRMDEIIRAVRDCPSGALSYAIDGTEARGQVDWDSTREPAIQVTKDGPYRITGGITLTSAAGQPEDRAEGASVEHYALCRCGHSQNKPYCSGMHWYVDFRDPVLPPGKVPTLYEWAGGMPALTRMSRLLYEKHVPADPLLTLLCADMPADQPLALAGWLAGALGGPGPAQENGDLRQVIIGPAASEFDEHQRARWVALIGTAADEAGLPADPEFRSALSACLEWASRTALAQAAPAKAAPSAVHHAASVPRWDWGPGGPPAAGTTVDGTAEAAPDETLPGPDQAVGFAAHIKPMFRQRDRQSMSFAFDLWSYKDVQAHATDIAQRLTEGSMPCDGAWPAARTEVFQRWIDTGLQP